MRLLVSMSDSLAPWERANWLSRISFHWMTSVMRKDPLLLQDIVPGSLVSYFFFFFFLFFYISAVAQRQSFDCVESRWKETSSFLEFLSVFKREILTSLFGAAIVFAIQFFIIMFLFAQLAIYLSDPSMVKKRIWRVIIIFC